MLTALVNSDLQAGEEMRLIAIDFPEQANQDGALLDGPRERVMRSCFEMIAVDATGWPTSIADAPLQTRDDAS